MRLVAGIEASGSRFVGVRTNGAIVATPYNDIQTLIEGGQTAREDLEAIMNTADRLVSPERYFPPVSTPTKLLFCGVNFSGHVNENSEATLPEEPFFFAKLPNTIIGPGDPIVIPNPQTKADYEVELAAVIGRVTRRAGPASALDHVFGYTLVNDVSARDVQFKDQQITLGKNADIFCPLGPEIVTADELNNPSDVIISCSVNGEIKQSASTSDMLFDFASLIAFLSETITLYPGDIVTTGTPEGVGHFRDPPAYLQPGDVVTVECDRIGSLTNPVIAGW